jgi:hypothetical protein
LASRFFSKSKPPGIHSLAHTLTVNPKNKLEMQPIHGYLWTALDHSFHSIYNVRCASKF